MVNVAWNGSSEILDMSLGEPSPREPLPSPTNTNKKNSNSQLTHDKIEHWIEMHFGRKIK